MTGEVLDVVRKAHGGYSPPRTLLVDDLPIALEGAARLSETGLDPSEMWACRGAGSMTLVVLSAPRSAREMFRVLSLAERLVAPGGKILLLPTTGSASEEVRPEATEVFCGVHPEWRRRQVEANVVELYRAVDLRARVEDRVVDVGAAAELLGPQVVEAVRRGMREGFGPPILGRVLLNPMSDEEKAKWGPFGKRVVSLSVFGDCRHGTDFWKQMPAFVTNYVLAHHALFPGYELRVHHDEHIYHSSGGDALLGLARRGLVRLVYVPSRPGQGKCERMLHRLMPAWDPGVEVVVCRDVDSLPTWRDRGAVEEFIESGADVHTILDSCSHMGIMGGLSAFRAEVLRVLYPTFEAFLAAAQKTDEEWGVHGADQLWLNDATRSLRVFEHCLPTPDDPRFGQLLGNQEAWRAGRQVTTWYSLLRKFKHGSLGISDAVREGSDALVSHLGSAGYDVERALAFYDRHSPIAEVVREAERFARSAL